MLHKGFTCIAAALNLCELPLSKWCLQVKSRSLYTFILVVPGILPTYSEILLLAQSHDAALSAILCNAVSGDICIYCRVCITCNIDTLNAMALLLNQKSTPFQTMGADHGV